MPTDSTNNTSTSDSHVAGPRWSAAAEELIADRLAQLYDGTRVRRLLEDSLARHEYLRRWLPQAVAAKQNEQAAHDGVSARTGNRLQPSGGSGALQAQSEAAAPFAPPPGELDIWIDLIAFCPAAASLMEHPQGFRQFLDLCRRPRPLQAAGLAALWRKLAAVKKLPGDTGLARLQWFRLMMQARIFLADTRRRWSLTQATAEISDLAAVVVAAALELAGLGPNGEFYLTSAAGAGRARKPVRAGTICVIGFGKLGGRELNYSSDIDLMYIYSPVAEASGAYAAVKAGRRRSAGARSAHREAAIDYHEVNLAAQRACQEATRLLGDSSGDGPLYRVDLRLRPHGSTGLIAQDSEAVKRYYYSVGRVWERQALLKARPLAGDLRLGRRLFEQLYTFLYPPFTGQELLTQIAALKTHIEHRAEAVSGDIDINVKTGPGGIRDIEFTIQLLQLLHAGDMVDLRVSGSLPALDALEMRRLVTPAEAGELRNAYVFLRHLEHRLQAPHNRQTHQLEMTDDRLREVAFLMGYGDDPRAPRGPLKRFRQELDRHRAAVRRIFESIFQTITAAAPDALTGLLESGAPVDAIVAELQKRAPTLAADTLREQARILLRLTQDASSLIATRRSRDLFCRVAPRLIEEYNRYPDPAASLRRFEAIVASLGAGRELYHCLLEQPRAMELFGRLTALAPPIAEILVGNPGGIDEIFDALQTGATQEISPQTAALIEQVSGPRIAQTLAAFQDIQFLRVAAGLLMDKPDIVQSARALTDLAEAILKAQFNHAVRTGAQALLHARAGAAAKLPETDPPVALVALGKFGGRGLSFGSDLDILFFHDLKAPVWSAALPVKDLSTGAVQAVLTGLETPVRGRKIYELDLKLRPDGKQGELVVSLENLQRYLQRHAAIWEQLSLTQARAVCGSTALLNGALAEIDSAIYRKKPDVAAIWAEARDMRDRQSAEAHKARVTHIKRLRGGICDVDFFLSAMQLIHGYRRPALRHTATDTALQLLVDWKLVGRAEGAWIREAYWNLRGLEFLIRLTCGWHSSVLPEGGAERERLEAAWTLHWELAGKAPPAPTPHRFWEETAPRVRAFFDTHAKGKHGT